MHQPPAVVMFRLMDETCPVMDENLSRPSYRTTPCRGCEGCGRAHFRSRGSRADPSTPHEGLASLDPAVVFQSCSKLVATLAEAG